MGIEINTFSQEDLAQIVKLDERAVGAKRGKFLVNRIEQAKMPKELRLLN
jgi:predicted N-acetyltransferase YhbS